MIHLLYNVTFTLFLILYLPYSLVRSLFQRSLRQQLAQRMGSFSDLSEQKITWVHAASVGEVLCSIPLLEKIKKEFPRLPILLTTMTRTGNETARKKIPEVTEVSFFPMDHPLILKRVFHRMQPSLFLIAETELWPNLLRSCGRKKIPVILFNGKISDRSYRRYLSLRSLFKEGLGAISFFLMQTEKDQTRIIEMGAPPQRTGVVGNIKFDQPFPTMTQHEISEMADSLGLRGNETILIGGSTHPGEEEILVEIFLELGKTTPSLHLILAPRHLERLEEVEGLLRKKNVPWARRTSIAPGRYQDREDKPRVILLDTMGELTKLYNLGTLVFIGGSLVPVGGHNPLEPLFFKKCVLFGPLMSDFVEMCRGLIEEGGAVQVTGKEDLALKLRQLLSDEGLRKSVGERGYQFLQKQRGATERIFEAIRPFLEDKRKIGKME
jgi:3-deoxy-D-manno-octulosonic-acid transferase